MIVNIIDRRNNHYDVNCTAIFEPAWHDNMIKKSSQFDQIDYGWSIDELTVTTVAAAIVYGNSLKGETTVFLYTIESDEEYDE